MGLMVLGDRFSFLHDIPIHCLTAASGLISAEGFVHPVDRKQRGSVVPALLCLPPLREPLSPQLEADCGEREGGKTVLKNLLEACRRQSGCASPTQCG